MTLIDAAELESGTELVGDVCIIGGGPAGLTLARRLRGHGRKILVLERGGLPGKPLGVGDSETTTVDGSDFEAPSSVPARLAGGANEWIVRLPWMVRGVRMVPLQPIDLERRDWVPHSGWPISWDALEPHLRRAHADLGLDPWGYDPRDWEDVGHRSLGLEQFGFETSIERFPRSSVLTQSAVDELRSATDVDVVIHAPVGSIEGDPHRVSRLAIDHGRPGRLQASAGTFVLAGGGIRNTQLLLSARDGEGIGANSGAVGRYFTDHLRMYTGTLTPAEASLFRTGGLYDLRSTPRGVVSAKVVPTAQVQRDEQILNSTAQLLPKPPRNVRDSIDRVRAATGAFRQRRRPPTWPRPSDAARVVGHLGRVAPEMALRQRRLPPRADAGWSSLSRPDRRYESFLVEHQIEQVPDRENGLRLSGNRDDDGRLTSELHWRWNDIELESIRATQRLFASAVERARVGAFEPTVWDDTPPLTTPGGSFHPSGMTRMSASPRTGVVDADCLVQGVENLYISGSSVFPTGGSANPTLTLLALAHRLADHINKLAG